MLFAVHNLTETLNLCVSKVQFVMPREYKDQVIYATLALAETSISPCKYAVLENERIQAISNDNLLISHKVICTVDKYVSSWQLSHCKKSGSSEIGSYLKQEGFHY